jgi:large subunit ribosomal protein L6
MSRLANKPISIPQGVEVKIEGNLVTVKGPKGSLSKTVDERIKIVKEDGKIILTLGSAEKGVKAFHGLFWALIRNMIEGVSKGFEKTLELHGVGYRAAKTGNKLSLALGYSHPIEFNAPAGIEFSVEGTNKIIIKGFDKELVGELAAEIRKVREVEPYKGKGVRYAGEEVRRKAGKAAKAVAS